MKLRYLGLMAITTVVVLGGLIARPVSAHAPIEWAEPAVDAVVEELPKVIKFRFAEEPDEVTVRTIEQQPKVGVSLTPVRIAPRTYQVALPDGIIPRLDSTLVLYIGTLADDGHSTGGVYLLHVKKDTPTTTAAPKTTTTAPSFVVTTSSTPVQFQPPAHRAGTVTMPVWLVITVLLSAVAAFFVLVHRLRPRR